MTILDPCSHCFVSQGYQDGPCKVSSNHPDYCVNQGENANCSPDPERYTIACMARHGK